MTRSVEDRQPLDLRLLPAACLSWAAAFAAISSSASVSLGLGLTLALVACALGLALWLLPQAAASRMWPVALQALLCTAVCCAVALSAAGDQRRWEETGWNQAVDSGVPIQVQLRVTADPAPLAPADSELDWGSETAGHRAAAEVLQAELPGSPAAQQIEAPVVLIDRSGQAGDLQAGQRYSGLVTLGETEGADRATAVAAPFGDEAFTRLPEDRCSRLTAAFSRLRTGTAEAAQVAVEPADQLLPGVILGDRSRQSQELTESMRVAGLSHMTVVSGTHCALVMGALLGMLRLLRAPRWTVPPALLLGLALFVLLVQPAPSVMRAAVMGSIGAVAVFAGRGRASSALLCATVVLLLIWDPWYAAEPAFQLSVAATAGIVCAGQRLQEVFSSRLPRAVSGPLALAVSAQLLVTPVLLPIAEGVTLYSVPANILAAPLLPLATVPGTVAAVLSTAAPAISTALLWLAGFPAAGIAAIGSAASSLPQALAPWPEGWLGLTLAACYTGAALLGCRLLVLGRPPGPRQLSVLVAAAGMLTAVVLPASALRPASVDQDWRFALCDVDQGDMLVVRTAETAAVVVDAGEHPELAQRCLSVLNVETVEVLMITHEHLDHYGGAGGIFEAAAVHQVLYSGSADFDAAQALEELTVPLEDVPVRRAQPGDQGTHGNAWTVRWSVWSAPSHYPGANDNSLVTLFELSTPQTPAGAVGSANNPLRLLGFGDLEEEVASMMLHAGSLPEHVDVLKVAHHGAANSGTAVLESLQPDAALIGVGAENTYGHPDPVILEALQRQGSAVYRTDQHGTVTFSLQPGRLQAERVERISW
ncbi:ComEC/Rec2 family competence protein [Nesterenkonia sp.]|uniref:ComEC/Rec2 family competence protein n=1 Tax=Nesterenkonia sp. TaxID=704201 RepID=UPI00261DBBFE|nr:ComEC/Rec2 family competence protein [Nesterenkonia sp.]